MVKLLDIKQCDAPESKSVKTGIECTNIVPVTTFLETLASSAVKLYAWPFPRPTPSFGPPWVGRSLIGDSLLLTGPKFLCMFDAGSAKETGLAGSA